MKDFSAPQRFAISLVSLSLAKRGYTTFKDIDLGAGTRADVMATIQMEDGHEERFAVEIKSIAGRHQIPEDLNGSRERFREAFRMDVFFAFFIDKEDTLIAEQGLTERMRFTDSEVRLEIISAMKRRPGGPRM